MQIRALRFSKTN